MLNPRAEPYELQRKPKPSFYMKPCYKSFHHHPPPPFSFYHHLPPFHRGCHPFTTTHHGFQIMKYPRNPRYGVPRNAFQVMRKTNPGAFRTRNPVYITPKAYKRAVPPRERTTTTTTTTLVWRPKASEKSNTEAAVVQSSCGYDFNEAGGKTTVMIKNIPNNLSKEMLLGYLDRHCVYENQKHSSSDDSSLPRSEYDFLYLPMDFRSGYNLGYAFVNFTNAAGAVRLYHSYHNLSWASLDFSKCGKICEIKNARIQGKEELVKHFTRSQFRCHTDDYLPTVFTPPRDGEAAAAPSLVGKRQGVCS